MNEPEQTCPIADTDTDVRYLAGSLTDAEAEAFEEHYFGCDTCWKAVQRGAEIRSALSQSGGVVEEKLNYQRPDNRLHGGNGGPRLLRQLPFSLQLDFGSFRLQQSPTTPHRTKRVAPQSQHEELPRPLPFRQQLPVKL